MRLHTLAFATIAVLTCQAPAVTQNAPKQKPPAAPSSVRLEDLSWPDAEKRLTEDAVVVLPLGAAAKEHGPHLKLRNDLTLAEYLTRRVMSQATVVVAPALTYHFYPAFLEYPGSTSLNLPTARDLTADAIRSLARSGPRRFYVLNTGISTHVPLTAAAKVLASEGILMHFTDLRVRLEPLTAPLQQQTGGTHADEIETSMMLYIDPSLVDMTKAVRDFVPAPPGPLRLTRQRDGPGTYSATGIWGDPTLATAAKGRVVVEGLIAAMISDIEALRRAEVPTAAAAPPPQQPSPPPAAGPRPPPPAKADACSAGDERAIRGIGPAFSLHWTNQDAEKLANLWGRDGDIVHPDGSVERSSQAIRQNRAQLFMRPEYKASRHFLAVGNIRCLTGDVAVADGKWDLREVVDDSRRAVPPLEGLCTLVLRRTGGGWLIEAYRYTVTPRPGQPPVLLKQPGFIKQ
jgi:creatinine amidohydrolase